MIAAEKPPLDEDLLVHFGVPGMKWGRRKARDSGGSSITSRAASSMGESAKQNKKAVAVLGVVAVGSVLYATGNLKAATVGGSKLAGRGALAASKILLKMGKFTLRTAGKVAVSTVKTTVNTGKVVVGATYNKAFPPDPPGAVSKLRSRGMSSVKGLFKRKPKLSEISGSNPIKERGKARIRSLFSRRQKLAAVAGAKPPLKLYPTMPMWNRKVSDIATAKPPLKLYPTVPIWRKSS